MIKKKEKEKNSENTNYHAGTKAESKETNNNNNIMNYGSIDDTTAVVAEDKSKVLATTSTRDTSPSYDDFDWNEEKEDALLRSMGWSPSQ